jgi:serine/threonine-protein kinase RsbW
VGNGKARDDLEAALEEQTRLSDQYDRAIGTSAEFSSYVRLQAAGERVTTRHRAAERFDNGFSISLPGGPGAPGEARRALADRLASRLDETGLDTLRLLVSEVTTNCVRHAKADAAARIDVEVSLPVSVIRVEVSTAGSPFERPPTPLPRPDPDKAGGRGLYVLDVLSQRWGIEPRAANNVWFELATGSAG